MSDNRNVAKNAKLLLNSAEAAAALSICQRKLWELKNRGEIKSVTIGRSVRYRPEDLQEFIAQNTR